MGFTFRVFMLEQKEHGSRFEGEEKREEGGEEKGA